MHYTGEQLEYIRTRLRGELYHMHQVDVAFVHGMHHAFAPNHCEIKWMYQGTRFQEALDLGTFPRVGDENNQAKYVTEQLIGLIHRRIRDSEQHHLQGLPVPAVSHSGIMNADPNSQPTDDYKPTNQNIKCLLL